MRRRLLLVLVAAVLVTVVPATAASAHGEKSQEGFLRMRTVGWTDVHYSGDTVQQGQTVTVTGTVKIMDAWPSSLAKGQPNTCFMSMIAPGPTIVLKERTINGQSMPTRIDCTKGRVYDFSMTFAGRRVGRWHVHPAFAVKGAGTLIGPGAWINVKENPAGFTTEAYAQGVPELAIMRHGRWRSATSGPTSVAGSCGSPTVSSAAAWEIASTVSR